MSQLSKTALDISGGVTTDAEVSMISQWDTENLMKPVGGSPRGLRVRPGVEHFDTITANEISKVSNGVVPVRCKLDASDGYPGGSYITALVRVSDRSILDMHFGIAQRSEAAPDEEAEALPGVGDWVPVAVSWASQALGFGSIPEDDYETDVNVIVMFSPALGKFRYVAVYGWDPIVSALGVLFIAPGTDTLVVTLGQSGQHWYESYDFAAMVAMRGTLADLVDPDLFTLPAVERVVSMSEMGDETGVESIGSGTGFHWLSRGGVFYCFYWDFPIDGQLKISRVRASDGLKIGDVDVDLNISPLYTYSYWPASRPDANGHVVFPYQTRADTPGPYAIKLAKINPATGAVLATLDITSFASGTLSGQAGQIQVIPLSSGYYFVSMQVPNAGNRKWLRIPSDLSSASVILSGRSLGLGYDAWALPNLGGINDTVYLIDRDIGDYPRLLTLSNISGTPAVVASSYDMANGDGSVYVTDNWSEPWGLNMMHFRMADNKMMWGMWSVVDLSDGSTTATYPVADEFGMHEAVDEVPGGDDFNTFGHSKIVMNTDPFGLLMATEGYLESAP